jgi:DNA-binding PadR family transcriptional regulator
MLKWKTAKVISLLRKMNEEKLIDLREGAHLRRGRPKKNMTCTALGFEFLETYRKLETKPIRARKEDFDRAVKDAAYAGRLVENGHSPFQIFMELNAIARNIKISSETSETA